MKTVYTDGINKVISELDADNQSLVLTSDNAGEGFFGWLLSNRLEEPHRVKGTSEASVLDKALVKLAELNSSK